MILYYYLVVFLFSIFFISILVFFITEAFWFRTIILLLYNYIVYSISVGLNTL